MSILQFRRAPLFTPVFIKYCIVLMVIKMLPVLRADPTDVMIVHSYGMSVADWVFRQESGFKKILGDGYAYHEYYMRTKQIPESEFHAASGKIKKAYMSLKPALVYMTDDNAFRLLSETFSKSSIVIFSGLNGDVRKDYPWFVKSETINGVLERPLVKRAIGIISEQLTKPFSKVLILIGNSNTAQAIMSQEFAGSKESFKLSGISVTLRQSASFEFWKKEVSAAKSNGFDAIMAVSFYKLLDPQKNIVGLQNTAKWISEHTRIPVFSVHSEITGPDLLTGSYHIDGSIEGKAAGQIALTMLKTKKRSSFPTTSKERMLELSRTQLKKFNLTLKADHQESVTWAP